MFCDILAKKIVNTLIKSLFELEAFLALQKILYQGLFIHKQNGIYNELVYSFFYYNIVNVNRILFFKIIITNHKVKIGVISEVSRTALSFDSALSGAQSAVEKCK